MKFLHAAAFAVILTVAGSPALRAQEPDEKEKTKQQDEEKKKQTPPAKEKTQPKPDERPKAEQDKSKARQESDKRNQPQKEDDKTRGNQDRQAQQGNRTENAQHGGRSNVRRIPEESFRVSFGHEHHFRVARRDDRRFEYSGFAFEYVDAWPSDWSYEDDCFIEQDGDDYYLVNLRHPGVRVLVVIVG